MHVGTTAAGAYYFNCSQCHKATATGQSDNPAGGTIVTPANHVSGTHTVVFDAAFNPSVAPNPTSYAQASYTCANTYCHSNGTNAAVPPPNTSIAWTASATCTSCHGMRAVDPVVVGSTSAGQKQGSITHLGHIANAAQIGTNYECDDCHAATVAGGVNPTLIGTTVHVNRVKDMSMQPRGARASTTPVNGSCSAVYCHSAGQDANVTPVQYEPVGWTSVWTGNVCKNCHGAFVVGDGALYGFASQFGEPNYFNGGAGAANANTHQQHVGTTAASCQNCHAGMVNATVDAVFASSHTNGFRDVLIAASFDANGAATNYNPTTKTCQSVTCHGSKLPQWGATLGCNGCHGNNTGTARTAVNGADPTALEGAPPVGVGGETLTTQRAVGAHIAHVNTIALRSSALACGDCHSTANHNNLATIDMGWSALATSTGRTITWSGTTCANTYCHSPGGVEMGGTSARTPNWTSGASQATCGTCHGAPPPVDGTATANHPQNTTCASCHGAGYATSAITTTAKNTHIDGNTRVAVDKPRNGCTACHGVLAGVSGAAVTVNTNPAAAPGYFNGTTTGVDTWGASNVTSIGVGAHDAHVRATLTTAIACTNCHGTLPASLNVDHADGVVAASWSALAASTSISAKPTAFDAAWATSTTPSCTNYCHSNASPVGGTKSTKLPVWTVATAMACDSCHKFTATTTVPDTNLSHSHRVHMGTTAAGAYYFNCSQCHKATATGQSDNPAGGTIVTPANHVSGTHTVVFDAAFNPSVAPNPTSYAQASYTCANTYCHSNGTNAAVPPPNTSIAWTASATCTSCHGMRAVDPVVVGSTSAGQKQGSITHLGHIANAAQIGTNYECDDCHAATVAGGVNPTLIGTTVHVNRVKDMSMQPRGARASTTPVNGSCSAVYCHSAGQDANVTPVQYEPVGWTSVWTGNVCKNCHGAFVAGDGALYGFPSQFGEPNYFNGGAGAANANSHQKHVGTTAASCQGCHAGMVNATVDAVLASSHTNGIQDLIIAASYDANGVTTNYNSTTKTCQSVTCHGTAKPQWGGTVTCLECHGATVDAEDLATTFWSDDTVSMISTIEWAYSGHGKQSGKYESGNNAAAFSNSPTAGTSECLYCHDSGVTHELGTNPFRLRGRSRSGGATFDPYVSGTAANYVCLNCHATGYFGVDPDAGGASPFKNGATKSEAAHGGAKHTLLTQGGNFCWDCHEPHGDRPSNTNSTGYNVFMIRSRVITKGDGVHGYLGTSGATMDVEFYNTIAATTSPSVVGRIVESTTAVGTNHKGLCQACHDPTASPAPNPATAWTKYWERTGNDDPDGTTVTIVPYKSGVTTGTHHNTTAYCITCHAHKDEFAGKGGGPDCLGCHGTQQQGSRRAVTVDFNNTNQRSHHVGTGTPGAGGTLSNADCVICHAEGQVITTASADCPNSPFSTCTNPKYHANKTIDLRDVDAVPVKDDVSTVFTYDNTAVRTACSGDLSACNSQGGNTTWSTANTVLDSFCLSCHDTNGASQITTFRGDATATAANPFADTTVTNKNDQANRTAVVDVKRMVDSAGSTDLDDTTANNSRAKDLIIDPPDGVYARHAITNRSASPYKTASGTLSGKWAGTWNETKTMSCADCHTTDGVNGAAGNAHGSTASEYLLKDASGGAALGTLSGGNYVCYRCHPATSYDDGTTASHTGSGSDYVDATGAVGTARAAAKSNMNLFGIACMACHGGAPGNVGTVQTPTTAEALTKGYGRIHGTSSIFTNRRAYRFMNGANLRYYAPGTWASGTDNTCNTLTTVDGFGGCTKHTGTGFNGSTDARPLSY